MSENRPRQITSSHRARLAVGYERQSTTKQVIENTGSADHQARQVEHARGWGWPEDSILLIKDEGLSGAGTEHRPGWQRMVKLIVEDQVGLVLVSDISRLSRDRGDFHTLVSLCRDHDVLLVVEGSIVNFDDPHDRFMANIRADVAEYDNWIRRETMMKGAWAKARRGHAVRRPPTGYVESEKGQWVKDPDQTVREALARFKEDYFRLGTVAKVLRYYHGHGITIPIRMKNTLRWVPAYRQRLYQYLLNPAYRGEYVYGRRVTKNGVTRRQSDPNAIIVVPGHHDPYITPEEWERIQTQLQGNRFTVRQPAGVGSALCQGIIRCGKCDRRMYPRYHMRKHDQGNTYLCLRDRNEFGGDLCWSVNGPWFDKVVAAELLQSLRAPELEAIIAAAGDSNAGYEAVLKQRRVDLEHAQYQVDLARRRHEQVDPRNRRVAVSLEQDWEQKLLALQALERQQAESQPVQPLAPTPEVLADIHRLAQDLPALWAAPTTTHQDRKLLLRLFVQEVRLAARTDITFTVEIHWIGGAVTRHATLLPFAFARLTQALDAQGRSAEEIVEEVARQGIQTTSGRPFGLLDVQVVLRRKARKGQPRLRPTWQVYRESLRALLTELVEAGLSDRAIAEAFTARRIEGFFPDKPWDKDKIRNLRTDLGLPSGRAHFGRREPLRAVLEGLFAAGLSDDAIADEFNRQGLRGFLVMLPWTRKSVLGLRHRLRILRGPSPRRGTTRSSSDEQEAA